MATVNGESCNSEGESYDFIRLSFEQMGEFLLEASPNKDGKGLCVHLNSFESKRIDDESSKRGCTGGTFLSEWVEKAYEKREGKKIEIYFCGHGGGYHS